MARRDLALICVYIYIHVCIDVCIYLHTCMHRCIYVYMRISINIYACICEYIFKRGMGPAIQRMAHRDPVRVYMYVHICAYR